jgi:hypothetical protein
MFGRLTLPALLLAMSAPALAQDATADLKATADAPSVVAELSGPDGCSVQLGDPNNWKLICIGTAAYDFNETDDIKDATRAATLDAKAALARFLKEKISTTESIEKMASKKASQATGQDRNVSKTSMETQLLTIKSSADAIITGVIVLEDEQIWNGKSGTVRVKLGQSQKTMALAGQAGRANAAAASSGSNPGTAGSTTGSAPTHTSRKSDSDF